jgi:hypothetical protein
MSSPRSSGSTDSSQPTEQPVMSVQTTESIRLEAAELIKKILRLTDVNCNIVQMRIDRQDIYFDPQRHHGLEKEIIAMLQRVQLNAEHSCLPTYSAARNNTFIQVHSSLPDLHSKLKALYLTPVSSNEKKQESLSQTTSNVLTQSIFSESKKANDESAMERIKKAAQGAITSGQYELLEQYAHVLKTGNMSEGLRLIEAESSKAANRHN